MAEIVIREVWDSNLVDEINLIQQKLQEFPYISIDTEFPGTIFKPTISIGALSPTESYAIMKSNVDSLHLIQLGLTLSDAAGNLPRFGDAHHLWQFNFGDFDLQSDLHNQESISLLQRQGLDFSKHRRFGINSRRFALYFKLSGLGLRPIRRQDLKWVTFHGLYDFGFLIKILTDEPLPDSLEGFMDLMRLFFGPAVYDLKPMASAVGLYGGLERIAGSLTVERAVGKSHQAGSDSLLTMRVMVELMNKFGDANLMVEFNYKLYGLTPPNPIPCR